MPRKSPPPDRPRLTRQDILRAALVRVDTHGLDGLSMRKLAAELNVEAMSLYNHVRHKQDLIDGLVNLLLEDIQIPTGAISWQDTLRLFARSMYQTFVRHPTLVPALERLDVYSPHVIQGMDMVLGALHQAGLPPGAQVAAFRGLNSLVIGFVMGHTGGLTLSREQVEAQWQNWDGSQVRESGLPNLARLAPYFEVVQPEQDFDYVLQLFITALEHQPDSSGPDSSRLGVSGPDAPEKER